MAEADATTKETGDVKTPEEKPLPKLTPAEFRVYNKMAEHMDYYHNHFRHTWNVMYKACETNKRPSGMSIRQFLATAEQFCHQLTFHHTIEEQSIFPVLAKKMPIFQDEQELLEQHKGIHEGLEVLEEYIAECRSGEKELQLKEMKRIMDGFGKVLWAHLDNEVKQLGAENMRKHWTLAEMKRMPM
jgi:hemerythrin-like domain-containing protein